jgi:hypothetical protein
MRLIARGVSVTAAVLLLTACGGDSDSEDSAAETTAASTSAAETSSEAPAGGSEFCTEAQESLTNIGNSLSGTEDPAEAEAQFQQAAQAIRDIEPPDEIADDWAALADGLEQLAGTVAGATSNNDPEAAQQITQQLQELQASATSIATYLQQECGIDASEVPTDSAAPSS